MKCYKISCDDKRVKLHRDKNGHMIGFEFKGAFKKEDEVKEDEVN